MNKDIVKLINKALTQTKTGLTNYKEGSQLAIELFLTHYNDKLAQNSKPLFELFKILKPSDKTLVYNYIKEASNIKVIKVVKDGLTIVFDNPTDKDNPLQIDNDFIDLYKWHDFEKEKPLQDYFDDNFFKTVNSLLAKLKKDNCKVTDIETKTKVLESLLPKK